MGTKAGPVVLAVRRPGTQHIVEGRVRTEKKSCVHMLLFSAAGHEGEEEERTMGRSRAPLSSLRFMMKRSQHTWLFEGGS